MNKTILIVDDTQFLADLVGRVTEMHGYTPKIAYNMQDGFKIYSDARPGIVLTDLRMPFGYEGVELAQEIRKHENELKVPRSAIGLWTSAAADFQKPPEGIDKVFFKEGKIDVIMSAVKELEGIRYSRI